MTAGPDIAAGRLTQAQLVDAFAEIHPPLAPAQAPIEASRCYYCYDAPCVEACPTGIDVPAFIRSIATGNVTGAAKTIFDANILGGMCARVCPVEELCEHACVRNLHEEKPVAIGALQRYATDRLLERGIHPYTRGAATGRTVAVVGAGPAGLSCAHRLAMLGHDVVIFEAKPLAGGLNEYGIAAYKMADGFAQAEVAWVLAIGGIEIRTGVALGREVTLAGLRSRYDAVFLGLGHNVVNALGITDEAIDGVVNAVEWIASLRMAADKATVPVGRRVVVIGGGNTAIDAATKAKRLGAEEVVLVYRRGPDHMSATWKEREWTQVNGVRIIHWAMANRLLAWPGNDARPAVRAIEFERTARHADGRLIGTGDYFTIAADQVMKAIGQAFLPTAMAGEAPELSDGRIAVDAGRRTTLPGVWAGGDCVPGTDLTVSAVQDGKLAAIDIDRTLREAGRRRDTAVL
jgi:dihydropyrimidine dehydrogenase (NAD+) subunit PreT